jgi:hypoxanthine phosphoribosyltransferase
MMVGTVASRTEAESVLAEADLLYSAKEVEAAVDRMAESISSRLAETHPLMLTVMNGGLIPSAWLATRLRFPIEMGYLHATRYRSGTHGGKLVWKAMPSVPVEGRVVLVVDDICDEGETLAAVVKELEDRAPVEVLTAVLVNKVHERKAPGLRIDFKGLDVEDRYVFGCGMDYHEALRNMPGIYALARSAES